MADLSKAFDCLDHELLNVYGFSLTELKLTHVYLPSTKEQTKINSSYSSWHETIFGVPQGSLVSPLLLNIFLIGLFFL